MPRCSVSSIKHGRALPTEPRPSTRVRRAWDVFLARPCEPMTLEEAGVESDLRQPRRLRELGLDVRVHQRGAGSRWNLATRRARYWCVGRTHPDDRYEDFLAARLDGRDDSV